MKPGAKYLLAVALTVLLAVGAAAAYKYLTSVTTVPPSPPDNTSAPPAGGRTGAPGNRNAAPDFTVTDGGGGTTSAGIQTEENRSGGALEILEKVWDGYTADEKFPATGGYGKYMKDGRPGKIDAGDAETLDFELGFPKSEASAIDDAASLMYMLNQNNFSCGVYHVKNSGDTAALAGKIRDNILNRQWLCGFPEKLVILTVGDYIVSVFGAAELTDTFTAKLSAGYSSAKQLFNVPIA